MTRASPSTPIPRSSSSAQMSRMRSGGSPSSPVTWTIRSVPPASGRHGGPEASARRAYAASRRVGDSDGGSTAFGIGLARSAAEAAQEAQDQVQTDEQQDELSRREGQRDVVVLDCLVEGLGRFGHGFAPRSAASAMAS